MIDRFDKLGRRIPQFDRSAAGSKGAKTQKEKYGSDFHAKHGTAGGRKRSRGYFGTLKDAGDETAIREAAKKGAEKTNSRTPEERRQSALKGWKTQRTQHIGRCAPRRRRRISVSRNTEGQA